MSLTHNGFALFASFVVPLAVIGCSSASTPGTDSNVDTTTNSISQAASASNGVGSEIPAYYDHKLFTIQFVEFPSGGETATTAKNGQQNNIWQCDQCAAGGFNFVSVIDAIPADGMNPLWLESQITFNAGFPFQQFFSDDEIAAAVSAGIITVTPTTEMYRCPVVGAK